MSQVIASGVTWRHVTPEAMTCAFTFLEALSFQEGC